MHKPFISVIIPVYNVEEYLDACIQSLMEQSYGNFELILVDDGSVDSSCVICDCWRKRDSRIKVIHQRNRGVSFARNAGLDIMSGQYCTFVDSDDFVQPDFLKHLVDAIEENHADIAFGGYVKICPANRRIEVNRKFEVLKILKLQERLWGGYGYANAVWSKLYKSSIIKKYNLRFDEKLTNSEDVLFLKNYLAYASTSVHCGCADYNYLIRENGSFANISRKRFSVARVNVWNAVKETYLNDGYEPWNNFVFLTAADMIVDSYRHPHARKDFAFEINEAKFFIKKNKYGYLFHAKQRPKLKLRLLLKMFFPQLIAKR